jgi:Kef-type K+ transport system membrane component KefB
VTLSVIVDTSLQILLCVAVVIVAATVSSRVGLPLALGELLAGCRFDLLDSTH